MKITLKEMAKKRQLSNVQLGVERKATLRRGHHIYCMNSNSHHNHNHNNSNNNTAYVQFS